MAAHYILTFQMVINRHNKIIIIEGVDKTGKSTLAKRLSDNTGLPIVHLGVPEEGRDHFRYLKGLIEAHPDGVIFDRFHFGDYVYAGTTRDTEALSQEEFAAVEDILIGRNALLIYCHDDPEQIRQRFEADGEDLIPASRISNLLERYDDILRRSKLIAFRYNFRTDNILTKQDGNTE